jgi:hypothetical protein
MKKSAQLAMGVTVVLLASLLTATGNGAGNRKSTEKHAAKTATPKNETYTVVQIGDDIKVVKKSELTTLQKTTTEEDKKTLKAYEDAKKEAKKNHEKYDAPKPLPRKVKKLSSKPFKTIEEANEWKDNFVQGNAGADKPKAKAY